jgi:hypothetical protein
MLIHVHVERVETCHVLGTGRKTLRVGVVYIYLCPNDADIDIGLDTSSLVASKQFARYSRDLSFR